MKSGKLFLFVVVTFFLLSFVYAQETSSGISYRVCKDINCTQESYVFNGDSIIYVKAVADSEVYYGLDFSAEIIFPDNTEQILNSTNDVLQIISNGTGTYYIRATNLGTGELSSSSFDIVKNTFSINSSYLLIAPFSILLLIILIFIIIKIRGRNKGSTNEDKLRKYAADNLKKGYTKEYLRKILTSKGIDKARIDRILR